MNFQGVHTSIPKGTYSFVIFQGGVGGPDPSTPSQDQRMYFLHG